MTSKLSRMHFGEQTLAGFEIFQGLPMEVLQSYSKRCIWKRFEAHQMLIEHKDTSQDVFFISFGRARATHYAASGREISFRDLGPGEMFGEISAIDGLPRSVTVMTLTEMLVGIMPPEVFRELLRQYDQSATALMLRLTRLIRCLSERVVEVSTLSVHSRVCVELLRLAQASSPGQNSAVIFPAPTHADIASHISTHREAVAREFGNLSRAGLLERRNRSLIIRDVKELSMIVSDMLGNDAEGD
jgi:CRP/FNR family transcriptional regulator, cyclic AMP receptor protein